MAITPRVGTYLGRRISASEYSLTIVYPPARAAQGGTTPTAPPTMPLTGTLAADKAVAAAPTPRKASVTMACLWLEESQINDLRRSAVRAEVGGWVVGAEALATVRHEDAVTDTTKPLGASKFDDADYVEQGGRRFTVLKVTPVGPSFGLPYAYHVWLKGAERQ